MGGGHSPPISFGRGFTGAGMVLLLECFLVEDGKMDRATHVLELPGAADD